ncbi:MAG: potassium channel family protein [Rhodobacter sp.]|jgi:hypothetical protein|nr:potassium channel family protein [Rhodobacter sp.]
MIVQLALGTVLIVVSTFIAGAGFLVMEAGMSRFQAWLLRPPHPQKVLVLLCASVIWILLIVTVAVWLWAALFLFLGIFQTLEQSIYFALVSFTTLGFGDILLPPEWRLLSGLASINGLLMIGLQTAMLIEVVRRVRTIQSKQDD